MPHSIKHLRRGPKVSRKLQVKLFNVHSISDKGFLIRDTIEDADVDISFLTETWLTENDNVKIECIRPNSFGRPASFPRITGRGGGIAIVSKQSLFSSRIDDFKSFEATKSYLRFNGNNFVFFCLYRPPLLKKNKLSAADFISDFEIFLDSVVLTFNKQESINQFRVSAGTCQMS